MSNPYSHTHAPEVTCGPQCPQYVVAPLPHSLTQPDSVCPCSNPAGTHPVSYHDEKPQPVEVPVQDEQSVSLTNPEGTTVAPKVYPEGIVLDLLERAYMEGAWIGGRGHANTPRTQEAFSRWIVRLRERGEL